MSLIPFRTSKMISRMWYLKFSRSDLHNNCKRLLNTLTKRGYNKTDTITQITVLSQFQEMCY